MFLKSQKRSITLENGEPCVLRFSHLATLEAEEKFGKGISAMLQEFAQEFSGEGFSFQDMCEIKVQSFYELTYCLSANYREAQGVEMSFRQFVAVLPEGPDLARVVGEMLGEAMSGLKPRPDSGKAGESEGNAALAPAE